MRLIDFLSCQPVPKFRVGTWAAGIPLAALSVLGVAGLVSSPTPAQAVAETCSAYHRQQRCPGPKEDDLAIFHFLARHHDALGVVIGIGGVLAAIWLALITGQLFRATRDLAVSTEALAEGAQDQIGEMKAAGTLAHAQLFLERQQLTLAQEQAKIAKEQHGLEEKQFHLTERQTDLASKQHGLQLAQYYADNRPRVVLKEVFFSQPDDFTQITFELFNTGGVQARILNGFICFGIVDDPRNFVLGTGYSEWLAERDIKIDAGSPVILAIPVTDAQSESLRFVHERASTIDGSVYFYGRIAYTDDRGEDIAGSRMATFRRRLQLPDFTFVKTGNPEHEHSD